MKIQRWIALSICVVCSHWLSLGEVVINEFSATASDRLLRRDGSGGYPKLGKTTPWHTSEFDDTLWASGPAPFGFGSFTNLTFGVDTSSEMRGKVPTLYLRKAFELPSFIASLPSSLFLEIRYNDGFVAFLNGVEVARRNMGNHGMFAYCDQLAFNASAEDAVETITLGTCAQFLRSGTNIICIQVHNRALTGGEASSLLISADLKTCFDKTPVSLFRGDNQWKYFVGVFEPSGGLIDYGLLATTPLTVPWALPEFNDSSWVDAPGPVGYDRHSHFVLGVDLYNEMYGITPSVYARTPFLVSQADAASDLPLSLNIDYDDGIVVYLNGVEVARRNLGVANTVTFFSELAWGLHNANGDNGSVTGADETIPLGAANSLLVSGTNLLSIQVHNNSLTSSDLIGRATLSTTGPSAHVLVAPEDNCRYFVGLSEPAAVAEDETLEIEPPDSESDWIELHNSGTTSVNIGEWSLTDREESPRMWCFPAGTTIEAGGYLVVLATGLEVGPDAGATYPHTSFKLGKKGEYLGLYDAAGALVDEIAPVYPEQLPFYSYARDENGAFRYHSQATPGAANTGPTYSEIAPPPEFSVEGGFYNSAFSLRLSAPVAEGYVRYTLDGSEPSSVNGWVYGEPILISANTVVRARVCGDDYVPSAARTHTYLIGQSSALRSVAAICINSDPKYSLYGPNTTHGPAGGEGVMAIQGGVYVGGTWQSGGDTSAFNIPMQYGRAFEKPSSLEFFPLDGEALRTDFGLRIAGSRWSRPRYLLTTAPAARMPDSPPQKPSFNLYFRSELGDSPRDYPFFPDYAVTKFDNVRLRAGKNDIKNPFIIDEFCRRLYIATGQEGSIGIFTTLYINGVYKGYFNLCERLREDFMKEHFDSEEDWDVRQVWEFASGDAVHWNKMMTFLRSSDLTDEALYSQARDYLDVDNFIDYLLVNTFAAMWDWPNNNWVAARERTDQGRWRFFMWDAEGAFRSDRNPASYDSFSSDLDIGSEALTTGSKFIPAIYTLLKVSPEFRMRFADRAQKQFFHEGALTKNYMKTLYQELRNAINPVMQVTIGQTVKPRIYDNWIVSDTRRNTYFQQLRSYDLWVDFQAPEFSRHGGWIDEGSSLTISNPNQEGTVYFTTNGVDPRLCGGAVAGTPYSAPLVVNSPMTLKARVLSVGGEWSPLQEASFQVLIKIPEFLPENDSDWNLDANWNSFPAPYPNGMDTEVIIYGSPMEKREVSLRAPVTVGGIQFITEGCPFRNRIRDRDIGNTLTFSSSSGKALMSVDGEGPGFVEFELDAGVILDSHLYITVNNTLGDDKHGALRLRKNWSGSGALVKNGPGMLSLTGDTKSYTGTTLVNQGVLRVTEPACPRQSFMVRVNSGGQLRLASSGTEEEPRVYSIGFGFFLGSTGRGGELPDYSGMGRKGGLRYDPDESGSYAVLSNKINFISASCIHVDGDSNNLTLIGSWFGKHGFVKSGGGKLEIRTTPLTYSAPIIVSNGTLAVNGVLPSSLKIAAQGVLAGHGEIGALEGEGTIEIKAQILSSPSAVGLNYGFLFGQSASPDYRNAASSGNALLRLTSIQPGGADSAIDFHLDCPLVAGDTLRGGIFVEGGKGLSEFLSQSEVTFYVPDINGSRRFADRNWSVFNGMLPLSATAMPEIADFGDGPRAGAIIEVRVAGPAVKFNEWVMQSFSDPAEQSDSAVSGPLACPSGDGINNLTRYAFDIDAYESAPERLPVFAIEQGTPLYKFPFDPGKNDLTTRVEAGLSLTNWVRALFDSAGDDLSRWDGECVLIQDTESGPSIHSNQFYRLRIQLAE